MQWDTYFMSLAHAVAAKSKDESTKVGAVIVGPDHEIRSTGYNGFCRGARDDDPARQERPLKYKFFEHAERNAIYNAARSGACTLGCTLYCPWPPCTDCARAMVQAGIKEVVIEHGVEDCPDRWRDDMMLAKVILLECGVSLRVIEPEGGEG